MQNMVLLKRTRLVNGKEVGIELCEEFTGK